MTPDIAILPRFVNHGAKGALMAPALQRLICHNLTCLIQEQESLGIVPVFWKDEDEAKSMVQAATLAV
jgi:hypothetical protein